MSQKLKLQSVVTITTAGTRVRLTTNDTPATSLLIVADAANTGSTYVGDSTVTAANGIPIAAGLAVSVEADKTRGYSEELILSDIYFDADTSGNKVRVHYLGRR